ncbi:DUF547 domain-containing protein, partial [bacterium]|nr:DUF547 domain-containing protein [bacterium]
MKKVVGILTLVVIGVAGLCCGPVLRPRETAALEVTAWSPQKLESDWNAFLSKFVNEEGRVDYEEIVANPEELSLVYSQVVRYSPRNSPELFKTKEERFSYWLNAYNIAVIRGVVQRYLIESVLDVKPFSVFSLVKKGGFFVGQKFVFGGEEIHLYKLEKDVIRKGFSDPRLHF